MTATVISNVAPFGAMTNSLTASVYTVADAIERLNSAVATASSGYSGTPGTEFEDGTNFGVSADPNEPGAKGNDYSYAIGQLHAAWATFWTSAEPYVTQLDNGVRLP